MSDVNLINSYQQAKQRYHQAEIAYEKARTLANAYAEELKSALAEEGVSSLEELQEIYNTNLKTLEKLTADLNSAAEIAEKSLAELQQGAQ